MAALIVAYDLVLESKRPNITNRLYEAFPDWARLSESSYAVETTLDPVEIHRVFADMLDDNDQLYAIPLKGPLYGQGPDEVNRWLEQHVR